MEKKIILVTGATDGIGKQTAFELAEKGHQVIIHGRTIEKSTAVRDELINKSGNNQVQAVAADLTDLRTIQEMITEIQSRFERLDVLINNAGVFENEQVLLFNGFERTFMVNHLAPFVLTNGLLELLKNSPAARIVNVSSMAQSGSIDFDNLNGEKYFDPYNAYAVSKLENILFTYKLHRLFKDVPITVNCLHPGMINTKLLQAGWGSGGGSLHSGAQNSIYAAVSPEMETVSGIYLVNQKPARSVAISYDQRIQDRLWEISLRLIS